MSTDAKITNLRWCLWHLDGVNADLIEAVDRDDAYLLEKLAAFKEALSAVHTAVSLLTTEERARLEAATSAGWFDRLRVQLSAMTRWCRNELGSTENICLDLLRRSAAVHRIGHSLEQIDAFRKMDDELAVIAGTHDTPDTDWSSWHPPGDWWNKFPKSDSWCRSQMNEWLMQKSVQRKGERGDIRFRLSFLKELGIEPPS